MALRWERREPTDIYSGRPRAVILKHCGESSTLYYVIIIVYPYNVISLISIICYHLCVELAKRDEIDRPQTWIKRIELGYALRFKSNIANRCSLVSNYLFIAICFIYDYTILISISKSNLKRFNVREATKTLSTSSFTQPPKSPKHSAMVKRQFPSPF